MAYSTYYNNAQNAGIEIETSLNAKLQTCNAMPALTDHAGPDPGDPKICDVLNSIPIRAPDDAAAEPVLPEANTK